MLKIFIPVVILLIGSLILMSKQSPSALNVPSQNSKISSVFNIPCQSNPKPKFTHDVSEVDNIAKVTPPSLIASKLQDRAFLWIDTGKTDQVPIYAPVDSDLVRGVYKISKTVATIDYDLHFQVSCEVWFYVNHIKSPIGKIKNQFPTTPANSTNNLSFVNPPMHFKAGDLIGYTSGTAEAHNFDFAVFDLNHTNMLQGDIKSTDPRFKNFICPFDFFSIDLKLKYYKKLDPNLISESNCFSK